MLQEEVDEEMVCQHCEEACWLKEDPCAMAEMKKRMEGEATVERDSLEAFFLRLLLLDNIKQEAQVHCQLLKRALNMVLLCCQLFCPHWFCVDKHFPAYIINKTWPQILISWHQFKTWQKFLLTLFY